MIKNFKQLAISKTRKDALTILEAGLNAINTKNVIKNKIKLNGDQLQVKDVSLNITTFKRIYLIGIGKAAYDAGCALYEILGKKITNGIIIDIQGSKLGNIECLIGTHPLPSQKNILATENLVDLIKDLTKDDLVIAIISGGGSALLCSPNDLTCDQITNITHSLITSGATIQEINTVRKHLSKVQGGQLAKLIKPAKLISLIFSDVPGNAIDMIASGPTVLDKTTKADALKIIEKYKLQIPKSSLRKTPKNEKDFSHVTNILMVSNKIATNAMKQKAEELKYTAKIKTTKLKGEAKKVGEKLTKEITRNHVLILAGETTVKVKGDGKGGRCQEMSLGALKTINNKTVFIASSSDGKDNSPVAGAIVDYSTIKKAEKLHLDPEKFLNNNDSYNFLKKVGGHIKTGITGSNVSDLIIVLSE